MEKEKLLAEAKLKFPVGTTFIPADISQDYDDAHYTTTIKADTFKFRYGNIVCTVREPEWVPVVFDGSKWATIVQIENGKVVKFKETNYPIF